MSAGVLKKRAAPELEKLQLVEDSVHLLRAAPARAWALYLAGAAPYGVGLVWFWLETTRSAEALSNLARSSAIVAALFLWKQITEGLFLAALRDRLRGSSGTRVSLRDLAIRQAAVQPSFLLIAPLALLATAPLAYAVSFYRQFSLAALEGGPGVFGRAWHAARYAAGAYWVHLGVLSLGAMLLYGNLLAAAMVVSQLGSSVFGVESLTSSPGALLRNTALHFAIGVAVYLCVDLLLDAATALQAFYADSRRTGTDILAGLRRAAAIAPVAILLMALPAAAQQGQAGALDEAIDRTLRSPEFAWRTAPEQAPPPAFVQSVWSAINTAVDAVGRLIETIARWFRPDPSRLPKAAQGGAWPVQPWLIGLGVVAAVLLAFVLIRFRRRTEASPEAAPVETPAVDARDEAVVATALAEDEWLRMAEQFMAKGEYRLALRVLHLACLRALSERGLVSVARWKTGMEYFDEVRRRSRQNPALAARFRQNLLLFETGWYSLHPVEPAMIDAYKRGLEEIRGHAH